MNKGGLLKKTGQCKIGLNRINPLSLGTSLGAYLINLLSQQRPILIGFFCFHLNSGHRE